MSAWELTNVTARLLLPPGVLIVLGLLGLALVRTHVKAGVATATTALVLMFALSMPIVSRNLLRTLENPNVDPAKERADAIVVLGGGVYPFAPEYAGASVGPETLERLRYAAYLQRRLGKPILVSGGGFGTPEQTEAYQMKAALKELGVIVRWAEADSRNTAQNARYSQKILKKEGIDSVFLVTNAWHMPRAKMAFQNAGLRVVPAPMGYRSVQPALTALDFVPSAEALRDSWHFFHEIAGIAWYRLKFARER